MESEARVGGARRSVHVHCKQYQTILSKIRLKVLRSAADLQLYDSEFQTEGALTQNAFVDNVSDIRPTVQQVTVYRQIAECVQDGTRE